MKSALVTGGADGLGAGFCRSLAADGFAVSIVDVNFQQAQALAAELSSQGYTNSLAIHCDVTDQESQQRAFQTHLDRWGGLDICILNAGVMESGALIDGPSNDAWKRTLDVNLTAVLVGTRLAARSMTTRDTNRNVHANKAIQKVILMLGSAGGIFPMPIAPVYSTSKAGVVMLTRSLAMPMMKRHGIRVSALCPQFTDTQLVRGVGQEKGPAVAAELTKEVGGRLLTVNQVVGVGMQLLYDIEAVGVCAVVLTSGDVMKVDKPRLRRLELASNSQAVVNSDKHMEFVPSPLPQAAQKIIVQRLTHDFRKATKIVSFPLPTSLPDNMVLVRNIYCGINASDVNFTSGRYQMDGTGPPQPPFDAGFETCGVVALSTSPLFQVGQAVCTMQYGGFSEYQVVASKLCIPVQRPRPEAVALLTSGLTASISLQHAARIVPGETVLVTAASGGTGQFFVQIAKSKGCHVIATCGGRDKESHLRDLGVDRVVDYKREDLKRVLKAEYPKGVDLVCELVGGDMFKVCVNALATKGRLLVIGSVSQYSSGWKPSEHVGLPEKLLVKSASLIGFFLPHYAQHFKQHLQLLFKAVEEGRLKVAMDEARFEGLERVADAVERLQSGTSIGKVYVQLMKDTNATPSRL